MVHSHIVTIMEIHETLTELLPKLVLSPWIEFDTQDKVRRAVEILSTISTPEIDSDPLPKCGVYAAMATNERYGGEEIHYHVLDCPVCKAGGNRL